MNGGKHPTPRLMPNSTTRFNGAAVHERRKGGLEAHHFPEGFFASTEPPFMNGGKRSQIQTSALATTGFNGAAVHERRKARRTIPLECQ